MKKPISTIFVGLPGLGKSSLIEKKFKNKNVFIFSTDNFIEETAKSLGITYNDAFKDNIKNATKTMEFLLDEAIKLNRDIVFDQTNLGKGKRKKIINRMKNAGYSVECYCIMPPETKEEFAEHVRRLESRPGKNIPNHALSNMMETFTKPSLEEGFDKIIYYSIYGEILAFS